MRYLVTNEQNKSFGNVLWGKNVENTAKNENFLFQTYETPILAMFLHPFNFDTENPRIWECETSEEVAFADEFTQNFSKVKTIKEVEIVLPTNEQRILFAIHCCKKISKNPLFLVWAENYLQGKKKSRTKAAEVGDALLYEPERLSEKKDNDPELYTNSIFPLIKAVELLDSKQDVWRSCAASIWRSCIDAKERNIKLNLKKISEFAIVGTPIQLESVQDSDSQQENADGD